MLAVLRWLRAPPPLTLATGQRARIIMRSEGTLSVMMNQLVWAGMRQELVGAKSVRVMTVSPETSAPLVFLLRVRCWGARFAAWD